MDKAKTIAQIERMRTMANQLRLEKDLLGALILEKKANDLEKNLKQ